jgi:hypothetical protein
MMCYFSLFERCTNGIEQRVIVKRLAQENDGSRQRCLVVYFRFVAGGDKYYRHPIVFCCQKALQLKSVHPGEPYIQDDAVGFLMIAGCQVCSAEMKASDRYPTDLRGR